MPSFEVLGLGGEKVAVIIDIGEAYTKCGFAGEVSPRHIIPSCAERNINGKVSKQHISPKNVAIPCEVLYGILRDFLQMIYFRHLLVNPKDRRVVICESVLWPTKFRDTLAKVLFHHFEVPSVLFVPSHLMSLFTLGVSTALVLNCGVSETTVLPIVEGIPMINSIQFLPFGAKNIHKKLKEELMEKGLVHIGTGIKPLSTIMDDISETVLEDIKVRTCFVGPKISVPENEARPASMVHSVDYPLDGGKLLRVEGEIREQMYDILFDGDDEDKSVATLLLDAIIDTPIDSRKPLAENLVLIGGTTMAPGFKHRLLQELHSLLQSDRYQNKLSIQIIKLHETPVKENCVPWLGSSIFGSLEILADRSVSRTDFIQHPVIPDWCTPVTWLTNGDNETKDETTTASRRTVSSTSETP